jgi:hypothetical protein
MSRTNHQAQHRPLKWGRPRDSLDLKGGCKADRKSFTRPKKP